MCLSFAGAGLRAEGCPGAAEQSCRLAMSGAQTTYRNPIVDLIRAEHSHRAAHARGSRWHDMWPDDHADDATDEPHDCNAQSVTPASTTNSVDGMTDIERHSNSLMDALFADEDCLKREAEHDHDLCMTHKNSHLPGEVVLISVCGGVRMKQDNHQSGMYGQGLSKICTTSTMLDHTSPPTEPTNFNGQSHICTTQHP